MGVVRKNRRDGNTLQLSKGYFICFHSPIKVVSKIYFRFGMYVLRQTWVKTKLENRKVGSRFHGDASFTHAELSSYIYIGYSAHHVDRVMRLNVDERNGCGNWYTSIWANSIQCRTLAG